jgi:voltage-gated potassium channel
METTNPRIHFIDVVVLILSIYVLGVLIFDTLFIIPPEINQIITFFDNVICVIFLGEFIYRFYLSPNKIGFLKWGWIDLLSSIPMLDMFRGGRVIRLIRIIRIIRVIKTLNSFISQVFSDKVEGTTKSVFLIAFLLIITSSISILIVENDVNSNIKSAEDAIWWTITTITTVGYGDRYPVTTEGRIIGMILMFYGVGIFGTVSAYFSSVFIKKNTID